MLRVMCWNVLAHEYTHYSSEFHENGEGRRESAAQARRRFEMTYDIILAENADVVLLQECSALFLPDLSTEHQRDYYHSQQQRPGNNSQLYHRDKVNAILHRYHYFYTQSYSGPGTAVLLNKTTVDAANAMRVSIEGSADVGGSSKSVTMVHVPSIRTWFISIHATWKGDKSKRLHQLNLLEKELTDRCQLGSGNTPASPPNKTNNNTSNDRDHSSNVHNGSHSSSSSNNNISRSNRGNSSGECDLIVIGGDFNSDARTEDFAEMLESSFLSSFKRAVFPGNTGLSGDFSYPMPIDHIFYRCTTPGSSSSSSADSPSLVSVAETRTEGEPANPYSSSSPRASDHSWIIASFLWQTHPGDPTKSKI